LVDKNRIIPALFIILFVSFFYFIKLDLLFITMIIFFISYDLFKSKILNLNFSIFFFLTLLTSLSIYHLGNYNFYREIIMIFIFAIFFLIFNKKFINISFSIALFSILFLSYNIILEDRFYIFYIIILSFINDTLAFFSGKIFKGPLIIPKISPNKTWSGTSISTLLTFFVMIYFQYNFLFSIFVSVSFFLGDILFSFLKRQLKIKDFSNLLNGHGGILDRFDSIFFPIFLFNVYLFI